jgi:predicted transcriptional regulator
MTLQVDLVLAIHPRHADAILQGTKEYELRTRFPVVPPGTTVYMYSTAPISAVVGGFVIAEVVQGCPVEIWHRLGASVGLSSEEFNLYLQGRTEAKAIRIEAPFRLGRQVSRQELKDISGEYSLPRSAAFLRHTAVHRYLSNLRRAVA